MFINPVSQTPVIQSYIRDALSKVLAYIQLPKGFITFHSFRRSGATYVFNHGVPLENIQSHGGWSSDAVWAYLKQANTSHKVARAFQNSIH